MQETWDAGSIPESGRSPGEGRGNSLQHSCLENPTDRGAWWATVHGIVKSLTQLKRLSTRAIECFPGGTCQSRRYKRQEFDPWSGRSLGGGHGNPPQYSCLENLMDRRALQAIVHRVTKTWMQPSDWAHTSPKVKGICLETVFVFKLQLQPFPGSPGWPTWRIQSYKPLQSHEPVP